MLGNFGTTITIDDLPKMEVSAYLLLVTRRQKQTGKYPVKLRVCYHRKSKDYTIGLDLTQEEYDGGNMERPQKEFRSIRIKMNDSISKANKILENIGVFTFQKFENAFYGRIKDAADIFILFDDYIANLKKEERIKTAISYSSARNSFKKYRSNLGLYDITASFLNEYHNANAQKIVGDKTVGLSDTTIGIYVRSLRSVYNYAISLGIIKRDESYPFGKRQYIIPAGRNIKKALAIDEVKLIYDYKTIPGSAEDQARDFWIFSYLCSGINFKDIALLQNKDIDNGMLRFIRAKTKNTTRGNQSTISCHLSEPAKLIISKWRNSNNSPAGYLFPILQKSDSPEDQVNRIGQFIQTTNKYMRRISASAGLQKSATTYFARHSAATILKRSGASIQQIQEALGHQNSSTTQKYLDSFDDDSKKELANTLSTFL